MIPQIREINFPTYATLSQATVSIADMGDRTITAQVKIDGSITPDFADWEVEFKGERYIQPLRDPQATKDNQSMNSLAELTFYHWAIYQLKRYYFVTLANVESGTAIVDKYVADLGLNLPDFAKAFSDMLQFYFPDGSIYVYEQDGSYINPDFVDYEKATQYFNIDHSYLWDVLTRVYEVYKCRWAIEKDEQGRYAIKFGYPVTELSHVFRYGFDGGLMSVQRQIQDDSIKNQLLGRGGEKNLPYMYFKDYERFHPNSQNEAYKNVGLPDPDAIPELENVYFSELRDSNFRSYVQGWKVNVHRQNSTADGWGVSHNAAGTEFTESNGAKYYLNPARMQTDWAYAKGATDEKFDPVEYVKDDNSIQKYGLLQGSVENNENIYPTIQGMEIEVPCVKGAHDSLDAGHDVKTLADEVVDVEEVITDEIESVTGERGSVITQEIKSENSPSKITWEVLNDSRPFRVKFSPQGSTGASYPFEVPDGYLGNILAPPVPRSYVSFRLTANVVSLLRDLGTLPANVESIVDFDDYHLDDWGVFDWYTDEQVSPINIPPGKYYVWTQIYLRPKTVDFNVESLNGGNIVNTPNGIVANSAKIYRSFACRCDNVNFDGQYLSNMSSGVPVSSTHTIAAASSYTFELAGSQFSVPERGAMLLDVPTVITPEAYAVFEKTVKVLNRDTLEFVQPENIPEGNYEIRVEVKVTNADRDTAHSFKVALEPAALYYNKDHETWKPTFDIWIKNIFGTSRLDYDSDDNYVRGVWEPLRSTEEMSISFITGWLSGHSDWNFKIASGGIHYDNSKVLTVEDSNGVKHDVRSEWRLTLIKSDAEADSIHKYVPYKGLNAVPKDEFYFAGIYLPWAYVYAAEKKINEEKQKELDKTKDIQPSWVVKTDKIKMHEAQLDDRIHVGDEVWLGDSRFLPDANKLLHIQSISYSWSGGDIVGTGLPEIEIVLGDKVPGTLSTLEKVQENYTQLSRRMDSATDLEQRIRAVGDLIYLRKDGQDDTSYSPTRYARPVSSEDYRKGIVGGRGWSNYINEDGESVLEVDRILVRKEMNVNNLVINQVSAMGGKEIISAASMEISNVELTNDGYVCYFEQHGGSIGNLFKVDDVALSQVFDENNEETKYYKRRVTAVGGNYVVLSLTDVDGQGVPSPGDVLAQYGNYTDANRRYVIVRDVIGGGYEQMLSGLDSVTATGNEYYFAGMTTRVVSEFVNLIDADDKFLVDSDDKYLGFMREVAKPRWFVGDKQGEYAEWENGELNIKGRIYVRNSGGTYSDMASYISTVDYLQAALPKDADNITTISGGIVLSKIIGVTDGSDLVAGLNASPLGEDQTHGTLMLFAGATDASSVASAKYRVYEDGSLFSTSGQIGGFEIGTDHIGINVPEQYHYYPWTYNGAVMFNDIIYVGGDLDDRGSMGTPQFLGRYNAAFGVGVGDNMPSAGYLRVNTRSADVQAPAIALYISALSNDNNPAAIYAEHGTYVGLRPASAVNNTTWASTGSYNAAGSLFHNHVIDQQQATEITLPRAVENGMEYFVCCTTSYNLTIKTHANSNYKIWLAHVGTSDTSFTISRGQAVKLIFFADWVVGGVTGCWLAKIIN